MSYDCAKLSRERSSKLMLQGVDLNLLLELWNEGSSRGDEVEFRRKSSVSLPIWSCRVCNKVEKGSLDLLIKLLMIMIFKKQIYDNEYSMITKIFFYNYIYAFKFYYLLKEKRSSNNNRQSNLVKIYAIRRILFLHFQPKRHKNDVIWLSSTSLLGTKIRFWRDRSRRTSIRVFSG